MGGYYPSEGLGDTTQPMLPGADQVQQPASYGQEQGIEDPRMVALQRSQENINAQKQEYGLRQQDLEMSEHMVHLLDPNVPKSARQYLFKEMSTRLGVDPKGENSKNVGQMLLGLDPDTMQGVSKNFAAQLAQAKPGEVTQLLKSVLTGEASALDVIKRAKTAPAAEGTPTGVPGTVTGAPPTPTQVPAGPEAAPIDEIKRRRLKEIGETNPIYQVTEPALLKSLNLDSTKPTRNQDLIKEGYAIPTDPKSQRELAEKIDAGAAGAVDVATNAARIHQLFSGKPETLGVVGMAARTVDQAIDQIKGAAHVAGVDLDKAGLGEEGVKDLKSRALSAAKNIAGLYKKSGIEQTAVDSARLQGAILDMAYSMAVARGIPGNRLTNGIIAQHLNTLGHSQSVAQFEATLADATARATERSSRQIASTIGRSDVTPNLNFVSNSDLDTMTRSPQVLPPQLRDQLAGEIQKRMDVASGAPPAPGKQIPRQSPTLEEEQQDVAKEEATRQRRLGFAEQREIEKRDEERARDARQARNEIRMLENDKNRTDAEERRYQLALRREERIEAHEKKAEIAKAFAKFGEALASHSSTHIGVAIPSEGGEDASAFDYKTPRRAPPPSIPDAKRRKLSG